MSVNFSVSAVSFVFYDVCELFVEQVGFLGVGCGYSVVEGDGVVLYLCGFFVV